ncbi:methyl-accepting chemotaxis protein [Vibrio penaeicida]|uniref:Methyl-accepting chemotaxis protein n=1 Tax=Vibrio penaeicida TaxID=104609 RepID=A0AAV5NXZ3_9VIBR|nr:methyl-accepting chemotaxis protein [Vibrio penaeicida]RTZ21891.1 methyl-accepting chemotaxis protein [Vibrio penaeicida]GLQ75445.1 methyl-accepting chemotaxis protein [Vibrio penaeicida]
MKGSVIRRMYAGFALIVVLFIATITIMMGGMEKIHTNFETVSNTSLPLVSMSNQTSVRLLSADKAFKDYLTTQSQSRMDSSKAAFIEAQNNFQEALIALEKASRTIPEIAPRIEELRQMEGQYFEEAIEAMDNYKAMFSAQEDVQKSSRNFQRLHTELSVRMKEYVNKQDNIAVKVMSGSYFDKLKDSQTVTSDALASSDTEFVKAAVNKNKKAVTHLNYAYRGLVNQLPSLKEVFDESVSQFTRDVGKAGGVLDQHYTYLVARQKLYDNIANLAIKVDDSMQLLESFNETASNQLGKSLEEAGTVYEEGYVKAIGIGVIVCAIALGIGYHVAHSVREPLTRILATLESLTAGDMTKRIDIRYNNEFSRVSRHINSLADNLHDILQELNEAADELTEVASANRSTSVGAQSQLNTQREQTAGVATAMTEMEHSVTEVAQSAQSSSDMVHKVESASESGRKIMNANISTINQLETRLNDSVNAVSQLQQMSSEIGSILDVIRSIAEQTNLLALNAAIEAARAGEQGRGFAVVADEVRVLAQKTTHSTSEIESMISNLQSSSQSANEVIKSCMSDMEQSVTQASDANSAMEEIQALILEISHMSNHISQAAAEQQATSSSIARSLNDINSIANQSYEAMSEIATVSQDLTRLSSQQGDIVHRFKL